ncbi:hypothetical protein BJY01DRAFT_238189 [Aspergillus pseudoustus]|uniref:F-box domain-containing protein n=1 Tax=Aspergillus pseudoustus TaxID=1810923 RepID=A0ABR4J9H9_9EURO
MELFKIPRDIWLSIKGFLTPADVENILETGSIIWEQIFKDNSWLEYALTFDRCSPALIGHNMSAYRLRKPSSRLYLTLIIQDHSGDLRYKSEKFFAALQDNWVYDQAKHEVHLSGITLNVYDVINSHDTVYLPLEEIFTNTRKGVHSEYCYYKYPAIRDLWSSDIMKWDPDHRTQPHATPGWWNGPVCKGRDMKRGCRLTLLEGDIKKTYVILPSRLKRKLWARMA